MTIPSSMLADVGNGCGYGCGCGYGRGCGDVMTISRSYEILMLSVTSGEMTIQGSQHPMATRSMIQKKDQHIHRH